MRRQTINIINRNNVPKMRHLDLYHYGRNNPINYVDLYGYADSPSRGVFRGMLKITAGVFGIAAVVIAAPVELPILAALAVGGTIAGSTYLATSGFVEVVGSTFTGREVETPSVQSEVLKEVFGPENGEMIDFSIDIVFATRGMFKLGEKALSLGQKVSLPEAISIGLDYGMALGEAATVSQSNTFASPNSSSTPSTNNNVTSAIPLQANPSPPGSNSTCECHGLK